jgi:hypothetical protein
MGLEFEEITEGIAVFVEMKDVAARACDLTLTCFHYCFWLAKYMRY